MNPWLIIARDWLIMLGFLLIYGLVLAAVPPQ